MSRQRIKDISLGVVLAAVLGLVWTGYAAASRAYAAHAWLTTVVAEQEGKPITRADVLAAIAKNAVQPQQPASAPETPNEKGTGK